MSDIVERLRKPLMDVRYGVREEVATEAADRIEELVRAIKAGGSIGNKTLIELQNALDEIARLRALNEELVAWLERWLACDTDTEAATLIENGKDLLARAKGGSHG